MFVFDNRLLFFSLSLFLFLYVLILFNSWILFYSVLLCTIVSYAHFFLDFLWLVWYVYSTVCLSFSVQKLCVRNSVENKNANNKNLYKKLLDCFWNQTVHKYVERKTVIFSQLKQIGLKSVEYGNGIAAQRRWQRQRWWWYQIKRDKKKIIGL